MEDRGGPIIVLSQYFTHDDSTQIIMDTCMSINAQFIHCYSRWKKNYSLDNISAEKLQILEQSFDILSFGPKTVGAEPMAKKNKILKQ